MKVLIMAGGSGVRFWPLSRDQNPKQLLNLVSNKPMIRETFNRIRTLVDIDEIFIATNINLLHRIKEIIPEIKNENIIIEPLFRDTAAAIAYGSAYISKYEKNPTIIVLASDHIIADNIQFIEVLKLAINEADSSKIVTLGIKPTRPETAYGYIELKDYKLNKPSDVINFLEKPDFATAEVYYSNMNFVWNSGMFVFKYDVIYDEFKKYLPNHILVIEKLRKYIENYSGEILARKAEDTFHEFEKISIDYAIMEKTEKLICIPVSIGWNDIGSYNSLVDVFEPDFYNNYVKNANYIYLDSKNNIVISEDLNTLITTINVENMIIVVTEAAILICNRNNTDRIKELITRI